jgi:transcriptional regulator with XRE-family HTH domain
MAKRSARSQGNGDDGNWPKVGSLIRKSRKRAGMTLKNLKAQVLVEQPYLSDIELGRRKAPAWRLRQIAAAVGMPQTDMHRMFQAACLLPPKLEHLLLRANAQAWTRLCRSW